MLGIVVHENLKLGDNIYNECILAVSTFFRGKKANCSPYFTAVQNIDNFVTQRS